MGTLFIEHNSWCKETFRSSLQLRSFAVWHHWIGSGVCQTEIIWISAYSLQIIPITLILQVVLYEPFYLKALMLKLTFIPQSPVLWVSKMSSGNFKTILQLIFLTWRIGKIQMTCFIHIWIRVIYCQIHWGNICLFYCFYLKALQHDALLEGLFVSLYPMSLCAT